MTYLAFALVLTIGMVYMLKVRVGQLERRIDALERSAPIEDTETEIPDEPEWCIASDALSREFELARKIGDLIHDRAEAIADKCGRRSVILSDVNQAGDEFLAAACSGGPIETEITDDQPVSDQFPVYEKFPIVRNPLGSSK